MNCKAEITWLRWCCWAGAQLWLTQIGVKVYPLATQTLIYLHLPPNKRVKQHSGVLILLSSGGPRLQQLPLCHIPAAFPTMPYIFCRAPTLPLVTFSWFGCAGDASAAVQHTQHQCGQSLAASLVKGVLAWCDAVNTAKWGFVAW